MLPLDQREQARLAVTSGSGALGRGTSILLHLEQNRLLDFRCRQLLAAALQKLAPDKAFAVDLDEFR